MNGGHVCALKQSSERADIVPSLPRFKSDFVSSSHSAVSEDAADAEADDVDVGGGVWRRSPSAPPCELAVSAPSLSSRVRRLRPSAGLQAGERALPATRHLSIEL